MTSIWSFSRKLFGGMTIVVLGTILLSSCSSSGKKSAPVASDAITVNTGKPKITGLVDLGLIDIPSGDTLPAPISDKRFYPGEWVLLKGKNLIADKISIDGKPVSIKKYFSGQPVFQIPTGLSPLKKHQLVLSHDKGEASYQFTSTHYIVVTDTDDKKIHLIRTNPKAEGGIEEEWLKLDTKLDRPLFNLISPDSQFLFCINIKENAERRILENHKSYILEVVSFHLTAPEKPTQISIMKVEIESALTDAVINDNNQLMLLGRQSLVVLSTQDPRKLQEVGRLVLPNNSVDAESTYYGDAIFLNNGTRVAALEVQSNMVVLIDISNAGQYKVLDKKSILPEKKLPFSVDLEADPQVPGQFWVLQAPNFRQIDSKLLKNLYSRYIKRADTPPEKKPIYRLQKMNVTSDQLQISTTLALPENYTAYYASFGQDGRLYVTTSKMDFLETDFSRKNNDGVMKAAKDILWGSISFGRILAIDTKTGNTEKVAGGVGIYYHLVDVPDIGQVFSLLKLGPSLSFPYMVPHWGVGIKSTGTYAKRKMDIYALFPPYSVGYIAYQD